MKKFDLKKAILENKATFFSSLNEGQFSWMTQDTGKQIGSERENTIDVYMFDNKGNKWYEPNYEGYGEFGGKDYYELLDQMNGGSGDRSRGINLAFDKIKTDSEVLYPALVTRYNFDWKSHDFTEEAENDPNQSWYAGEEYGYRDYHDEELEEGYMGQFYAPEYLEQKYGKVIAKQIEDEIYEMDPNAWDRFTGMESAEEVENYISDIKDMINLNEGDIKEKNNTNIYKVAEKFANYMSKKEGKKFTVNTDSVDEYSFDLDLDGKEYEGGSYLLKGDNIVNVAMPGNPSYAKINQFLEEGEAAYEYEKGKAAGEKIEKKKMKMSELRAKIKEIILAEMDGPAVVDSEYDFLAELEEILEAEEKVSSEEIKIGYKFKDDDRKVVVIDIDPKRGTVEVETIDGTNSYENDAESFGFVFRDNKLYKELTEAKKEDADKEKDVDIEAADDVAVGDEEITTDTEVAEVDPNVKAVQDALTQAQTAAQQLGDKKLINQIGNTITFFTRAHVVEKPGGEMN
jgi:hypothetical protein